MQELISKLINIFKIILNENFDENKYNRSYSIQDIKDYIRLLEDDLYAIKDIDKYLLNVSISEDQKRVLEAFKTTIAFNETNNIFSLDELDKYRKTNIYSYIKSALVRQIILLSDAKKAKEDCLKKKQICLKILNFLQKHDCSKLINEQQLHTFYNFINSINLPQEKLIEINLLLFQFNLMANPNLELSNKYELVESINKFNMTKDQAVEIFAQYGYDFNLVDSKIQEELLVLGNVDSINEMFSYFEDIKKEHKINFNEKDNKMVTLLYKSKPDIFDNIIELAEGNISLAKILETMPSVFIHKGTSITQNSEKKKKATVSEQNDKTPSGSYEDFILNIELFKYLGYDIKEVFVKNADILTIPHERIKRNVDQLKLLGIDLKTDKKKDFKLSALKSTSLLLTMDKFIELGEYDYLMNNLSRFYLEPNSIVFYRLFHVKKHNNSFPNQQIEIYYDKNKTRYKGYISNSTNKELGINEENKISGFATSLPIINRPVIINEVVEKKLDDLIVDRYDKKVVEIDSRILMHPVVQRIDDNFKTSNELIYNINGILISRHKFLRNFMAIVDVRKDLDLSEIVEFCLIKDSLLT